MSTWRSGCCNFKQECLLEEVTSDQRLEGGEGVSHTHPGEIAMEAAGAVSAKEPGQQCAFLCSRNIKEASQLEPCEGGRVGEQKVREEIQRVAWGQTHKAWSATVRTSIFILTEMKILWQF